MPDETERETERGRDGPPAGPRAFDASALLTGRLGEDARFWSAESAADLYFRNPFRLLGLPASSPDDLLERARARFHVLWKLNPERALISKIETGSGAEVIGPICLAVDISGVEQPGDRTSNNRALLLDEPHQRGLTLLGEERFRFSQELLDR